MCKQRIDLSRLQELDKGPCSGLYLLIIVAETSTNNSGQFGLAWDKLMKNIKYSVISQKFSQACQQKLGGRAGRWK